MALGELARVEALQREGLISEAALARARAAAAATRLDYYDAVLGIQGRRFKVQVVEAAQVPTPNRLDCLYLTLQVPEVSPALLAQGEGGRGENLSQLLAVANITVSILDEGGTIVVLPWEATVPFLRPGERTHLEFQLLKPLEAPTVVVAYGSRVEERRLYFRTSEEAGESRLVAIQPALEAMLRTKAVYQLRGESFGGQDVFHSPGRPS